MDSTRASTSSASSLSARGKYRRFRRHPDGGYGAFAIRGVDGSNDSVSSGGDMSSHEEDTNDNSTIRSLQHQVSASLVDEDAEAERDRRLEELERQRVFDLERQLQLERDRLRERHARQALESQLHALGRPLSTSIATGSQPPPQHQSMTPSYDSDGTGERTTPDVENPSPLSSSTTGAHAGVDPTVRAEVVAVENRRKENDDSDSHTWGAYKFYPRCLLVMAILLVVLGGIVAGVMVSSSGGGGGGGGDDDDKPSRINNAHGPPGNYCGSSWADSHKCRRACPLGKNFECPDGETCFAEIECRGSGGADAGADDDTQPSTTVGGGSTNAPSDSNYCGSTWLVATKCASSSCPSGLDGECADGEKCFAGIVCSKGGGGSPDSSGNTTIGTNGEGGSTALASPTGYCGTTWLAATKCASSSCPRGLDGECPDGEKCFAGIVCSEGGERSPDRSGNATTGTNDDSGSTASASPTNYCGTTWLTATKCASSSCPRGLDGECPDGEKCFSGIVCGEGGGRSPDSSGNTNDHDGLADAATTNYCGTTWLAATKCGSSPCPRGLDGECPGGEKCFAGIVCSEGGGRSPDSSGNTNDHDGLTDAATTNYCGTTWLTATRCGSSPCPRGLDGECPGGEKCFAGIVCSEGGGRSPDSSGNTNDLDGLADAAMTNYCGATWLAATKCGSSSCPRGLDGECPGTEKCFAGIVCSERGGGSSNSSGNPNDDGGGLADASTTNYCGTTWLAATKCASSSCPRGLDGECPSGESCFAGVVCGEGGGGSHDSSGKTNDDGGSADASATNYCGTTWLAATKCDSSSCPSGLDGECPDGEKCFAGIACSGAGDGGTNDSSGNTTTATDDADENK